MSNLFLDTNILVYAIDADSQYHQRVRKLFVDSEHELFTSLKNLSEFLAVVTRFGDPPLSIDNALEVVESFTKLCTILYPTSESTQRFYQLLHEYQITGLDIHDVEIASIALSNHIPQIVTFNTSDFAFIRTIQCIEPSK